MAKRERNLLNNLEASDPDPHRGGVNNRFTKLKCTHSSLFIVFLVILICICSPANATTPESTIQPSVRVRNNYWNEYFLPTSITPTHYELTLQLLNTTYDVLRYNQTDGFYGRVSINCRVNSRTNFIVLHARFLTVQTITVSEMSRSNRRLVDVKIVERIFDSFYDYMILVLERSLSEGSECLIDASYSGITSNKGSGVITTIYNELSTNKKLYLLYSHLEPAGARQISPCFDEPDKKAIFTVKIIHLSTYQALSNMPLSKTERLDFSRLLFSESHWNRSMNLMISEFQPSRFRISPYLMAFAVINNYQNIEMLRRPGKPVRVWCPTDIITTAQEPLKYAALVENFFERHFNYLNPMPKTDHIYIPDFLAGGMENWGLITYRDKYLLINTKQSAYDYMNSLTTITHELAHFWFGDLVTTKTWGDIWLNEAFATFFSSVAYYKLLSMDEAGKNEFYLYNRRNIMPMDVIVDNTVVSNVTDPRKFEKAFTDIVYYKGGFLLAWMESMMGASAFHRGIKNYISKFAGLNTITSDFISTMEIERDRNNLNNIQSFKDFFDPWLHKGGYPVVMVNYDLSNRQLILTQSSYLINSSSSDKWPIQMTYRVSSRTDEIPIYFNDTLTIKLNLGQDESVVFNNDGRAYVRVNYSEVLWQRIVKNLKSSPSKISRINKVILFDDALDFAEKYKLNLTVVRDLLQTLVSETSPMPWLIFFGRIFDKLQSLFRDDELFIKFSEVVKKLSKNILDETMRISANSNLNVVEDLTQKVIFTMNCNINNENVLTWVSSFFQRWIQNPKLTKLPKHLVSIILFYGIRSNDNDNNWNKLFNMLKSKNYGDLTFDQIAFGLAGTAKPFYQTKLLDYFLTPNTHRSIATKKEDLENVIYGITKSTAGVLVVQRWLVSKSELIKKFAFGDNISPETQNEYFQSLLTRICKFIYEPHMVAPLSKLQTTPMGLENIVTSNNNFREQFGRKLIEIL